MTIDVPDGDRTLHVTLWYPAKAGGTSVRVGDSPVFEGIEGQQDAPVADGPLPIILVSHGGIRAAPNHGNWLGSRLAARGFVAAVVRGPTLGPRDADIALHEIWRRPADLSAALSALENDPKWAGHLGDKAGAVGFFLGGTSVLALVGAQLDAARFMRSCDEGTGVDCAWFAESGIDLHSLDTQSLTRSNLDPRVKVAIAVDPELVTSFAAESLAGITVPVEIINLGRLEATEPGLPAGELASVIPEARYHTISGAAPFSAFSPCKPQGPAILREEGESDAICQEPGDQSREAIHVQLVELIADALARQLHGAP
jgi:predicted dienelactone hydrolase